MKSPKLRFILRVLLSCALITLLLSRLNWSEVARLIHGVIWPPLLAGIALGILGELLMAERTRLMLQHWTVKLSRGSACSVTWVGQFCNNFLPAEWVETWSSSIVWAGCTRTPGPRRSWR